MVKNGDLYVTYVHDVLGAVVFIGEYNVTTVGFEPPWDVGRLQHVTTIVVTGGLGVLIPASTPESHVEKNCSGCSTSFLLAP